MLCNLNWTAKFVPLLNLYCLNECLNLLVIVQMRIKPYEGRVGLLVDC